MASNITVSDTAGLLHALASAQGGDTISLAAGTYSGVNIQNLNFASTVTITSADPGNLATLKDLNVKAVTNLNFDLLELSTAGLPVGQWGASQDFNFLVAAATNVNFSHLNVHGDPAGTLATDISGLLIRNSTGVTVTSSEFS
ncbi:MAG: hypothetical protein ABI376_00360, partial [Caulobacteraceae bacterium]